jgi:hypothetical protein
MKRAAVTLALLLTLAGCDNATTGVVTSRQHVEQHDELAYFECTFYDGKGNCLVQMPVYETVAECWQVNFHNDADDENGSACVDPAEYQLYRLGDAYPRPDGAR